MESTVVMNDMSEPEGEYDELGSDDSFNDCLNSDDHNEDSGSSEELENIKPGGNHAFHSCPSCRFVDFESKVSSQGYLWAKMKIRTHSSVEQGDCEFLRFCREQCDNLRDSAALYIYVGLKDGRPCTGSKVDFTFSGEDSILPGQRFLTGRVHPGPGEQCNCKSALLRQQPSTEIFESAQRHIRECELKHPWCPKRERSFKPLRLIHIYSPNHIVLYSPEPEEELRYAVLSYCWGGPQQYETRKSNFADRVSSGMPIKRLSKTLQEAVEITNKLGLKYLWADSLCIIQDNNNDKEEQIMQMPDIYAAAEVTIAASCARRTSEGFLKPKGPQERLFRFSSDIFRDIFVLVQDRASADSQPLDTRAWALQEMVLSMGILNFTTRAVRYECGTSVVDLDTIDPENYHPVPPVRQLSRNLLGQTKQAFIDDKEWSRLVEEYSRRRLSFPDDRLLAISGLAARFGPILKSNYLAGIWESQLPHGLLWRCTFPQTRPQNERAPSWSWVSIDGPVSYDARLDPEQKYEAIELHSVSVLPQRIDAKYGSVRSGGSICVSSLAKSVRVVGKGCQASLVDAKTKAGLHATLHFDTVSDGLAMEDEIVCAFNYYKIEALLLRQAARELYTIGLLLVQVSGRNYRRVGIYDSGCSTDWFINSNLETIYIV